MKVVTAIMYSKAIVASLILLGCARAQRVHDDGIFEDIFPEATPAIWQPQPSDLDSAKTPEVAGIFLKEGNLARLIGNAIPDSVKQALLNDANAPKSLAAEFSGEERPEWYTLPEEARTYYEALEVPTMSVELMAANPRITDPVLEDWISRISSYRAMITGYQEHVSTLSEGARKLAKAASENSVEADSASDTAEAASASLQSVSAQSLFRLAASESQVAARALFCSSNGASPTFVDSWWLLCGSSAVAAGVLLLALVM